jgi:hypothetical protein
MWENQSHSFLIFETHRLLGILVTGSQSFGIWETQSHCFEISETRSHSFGMEETIIIWRIQQFVNCRNLKNSSYSDCCENGYVQSNTNNNNNNNYEVETCKMSKINRRLREFLSSMMWCRQYFHQRFGKTLPLSFQDKRILWRWR